MVKQLQHQHIDQVYRNSRRETRMILLAFTVFLGWTLTVSYWLGYEAEVPQTAGIAKVFGIPAWVFWGVMLPWLAANAFTIWFCLLYMKDDDLSGDDPTGASPAQPEESQQQS